MNIVISPTAYHSGGMHQYVCGLTLEERDAVLHGRALVAFVSRARAHGKHGTHWRVCKAGPRRRVYPRVPSPEQLAQILYVAGRMVP